MSALFMRIALIAIVLVGIIGVALGYRAGHAAQAEEMALRDGEITALKAHLALAEGTAAYNASQLTDLRASARDALERAAEWQAAATTELVARAKRIATLERNADRRKTETRNKASTDEDCADLRDLPVCDAVARRLWGDEATADPH